MTQYVIRGLAAIAALALGFPLYVATGMDDPYISFWAASTLVEFGEILNYNGLRIEQSSSLLHTLILAFAKWVSGAPLPALGYWCGVFFAGLTAFRAPALASRLGWGGSPWLVLIVGTGPCLLFHAFGSLETPIVAWLSVEVAILAVDVVSLRRAVLSPVTLAVTLAYVMARPEAGIVLAASLVGGVGVALLGRWTGRGGLATAQLLAVLRWLGLALFVFASLCAFRQLYFGEIFPQPVAMKVGGGLLKGLADGLRYAVYLVTKSYGLILAIGLLAVPVVALIELRKTAWKFDRLILLLLIGANTSFVLFSGGDWMPAGRFFAHFSSLVLVLLFGISVDARLRLPAARALFASWLVLNLTAAGLLATHRSQGRPIWAFLEKDPLILEQARGVDYSWHERANQFHTRDILTLGRLSDAVRILLETQEKVTVMSGQAGMNAYYLAEQFYGRVEFMDRRALSTRHYEVLMEEIGLGTTTYGLDLTLEALFAEAKTREGPIWSPDLIFDVVEKEMLDDRNGYRIMHEQIGKGAPYIENPRSALHATFGPEGSIKFKCRLPLGQYIAVREDLADRFERSIFDWDEDRKLRLVDTP